MKKQALASSSAEKKILLLEKNIREIKKELALLRKKTKAKKVGEYLFKNSLGKSEKLTDLFRDKEELILVHNMGKACIYCTIWADGFNGIYRHLENRASFVVVNSDDTKTQNEFAKSRGWNFRLYSSKGTGFKHDMGFEPEPGDFEPGVSIFVKDKDGNVFHQSSSRFGPGDNYCNLWDLFDLLPTTKAWSPKYNYAK